LASWVRWCSVADMPQTKRIILKKAKSLATAAGNAFATPDGLPSQHWWVDFLRRHDLTLRVGHKRTASPPTQAKIDAFYRHYNALMDKNEYSAEQIWNMDETGFQRFSPDGTKVCVDACMRRKDVPRRIGRDVRQHITLLACVNANGVQAPLCWLIKGDSIKTFVNMLPGTPKHTHCYPTGDTMIWPALGGCLT
jgi:hypothetical protein